MGVGLERRAAPSAIAGRGRETATAIRTELCVRFGTGTMGGTNGMREAGGGRRDAGCGMRRCTGRHASPISPPASRRMGPGGSACFGGVIDLQRIVVRIGIPAPRPIG